MTFALTERRPTHLAVALLALLFAAPAALSQPADSYLARAEALLAQSPIIDGHNDLPWAIRESGTAPRDVGAYDLRQPTPGMTDLARLARGHVGGQFWSVYIPGEADDAAYAPLGASASAPGYARVQLEQIDIAQRLIAAYPELVPARTAAELGAALAAGKVGSVVGMEGGHAIENSLGVLRAYGALGVRYMTLTHNVTLDWADAALDTPRHDGLTAFGREVVREMNRIGMLVDLSHVSPATMSDALDVTEAPVIFSHSSARAVTDVARNVPDDVLRRMPANGGVVMVTFVPSFVSQALADWEDARTAVGRAVLAVGDTASAMRAMDDWRATHPQPHATIGDVADHLDHVRQVAGADHVGLGGDFDGITETVRGLEDVSTYPALFAELLRRGWSEADLRKLAGENVLRAFARADEVAVRLQRERPPSTRTIDELDGER